MKRVYHPFHLWEEHKHGMWRVISGEKADEHIARAIGFTGDALLYGLWMMRVIDEWPMSCEHNLTCLGMNRQAWIGHAACCLAIGCPEELTRLAWHRLTTQQQDEANEQADIAISTWEKRYAENKA